MTATRRQRDEARPLLVVGTSHHLAPVAIRERLLGKSAERAADALAAIVRARVGPCVVLSTCNRLELYCWTHRPRAAQSLVAILREWSGAAKPHGGADEAAVVRRSRAVGEAMPHGGADEAALAHVRSHRAVGVSATELAPYLYTHRGLAAARHLIRVAAGLDSLALGESEVLGQVRSAWRAARHGEAPSSTPPPEASFPPELDLLFRSAIDAARRIRARARLDRHPSIAQVAVDAACAALGGLSGRTTAVLGAGATGQQTVRALIAAGAARVILLNRSRHRLAQLDADLASDRVRVATLDALDTSLVAADVLFCATASPTPVVTRELVAAALPHRAGRPLLVVDIALPRDVEPVVGELPGVRLIDLDTLAAQCAADETVRRAALEAADASASQAASAYVGALRLRGAVPDVLAIRTHAEAIRAAELRRVRGRLARLTPRELATVEHLTHAIVQKLLHPPTVALRRAPGSTPPEIDRRTAIVAALTDPTTRRAAITSARSRPASHPPEDSHAVPV